LEGSLLSRSLQTKKLGGGGGLEATGFSPTNRTNGKNAGKKHPQRNEGKRKWKKRGNKEKH